jgi:DNA topoisomerase-1
MAANVVVVESPAKAKTIEKYLGPGFTVLASYGHVRDLPAKDGSVLPDEDFAMTYVLDARGAKHIAAIAKAVKGAGNLYLATDPDREGEAISWHVAQALEDRHALDGVTVKRVAFHEITKSAVQAAMAAPRDLDMNLINAQQARRALDYLVGFTLSPVLWRKLPGSRSAGRVQSVALRLVCERESLIEAFKPREYWTIESEFRGAAGEAFTARLTHLDGVKLGKYDLPDEAAARSAAAVIAAREFTVSAVEAKQTKRSPAPPFTTSTLQQEAARKLGFTTKRTMQTAQRLYEGANLDGEMVGLITYMRTDSVTLAGEALTACRRLIGASFGPAYLPDAPRAYRSTAKNAQEAHEAIRPTGFDRRPEAMARYLEDDQRRLYELIWKRAVACQMENALIDRVSADIAPSDGAAVLRATGSRIAFDGFLKLYREGRDDGAKDDDSDRMLPALSPHDALSRDAVRPDQHFTEPLPRFTEATLVKRLEELGIGRPSTYANILSVLQERDYVRLEKKRFFPEDRGRLVTAFLESFFARYVEYGFTAELEDRLDDIANGRLEWKGVLREFWTAFIAKVDETKELRVSDVLTALDEILGPHIFADDGSGKDRRACPSCDDGRLNLKLGKFGAFVGCANYPDCRYTRPFDGGTGEPGDADNGPVELGLDPASGLMVTSRKGPYGNYVQLGEQGDDGKPKRVSLLKPMTPADLDLEIALGLLSLPREVGAHPETNEMILAGIGRFGPYLKHGKAFVSLKADDDVLVVGLNRAVSLLAEGKQRGRKTVEPLREIGAHPRDGEVVKVMDGRYGPYLNHNGINAPLPKTTTAETITIEQAVAQLDERGKAPKGRRRAPAKKKPAARKKSAAKKKPAAAGE